MRHPTKVALKNEQHRYMLDVAERFDRVLAVTGERPGALAKLFCANFVGWAKKAGASRKDAERLFSQTWERFQAHDDALSDVAATVKSDTVDDGN